LGNIVAGVAGGQSSKPVVNPKPKPASTVMTQQKTPQKDPVTTNIEDRRRQTSGKQRSTILTKGAGLTEPAKTAKKELLGS
jgi:hypothetical protein